MGESEREVFVKEVEIIGAIRSARKQVWHLIRVYDQSRSPQRDLPRANELPLIFSRLLSLRRNHSVLMETCARVTPHLKRSDAFFAELLGKTVACIQGTKSTSLSPVSDSGVSGIPFL